MVPDQLRNQTKRRVTGSAHLLRGFLHTVWLVQHVAGITTKQERHLSCDRRMLCALPGGMPRNIGTQTETDSAWYANDGGDWPT